MNRVDLAPGQATTQHIQVEDVRSATVERTDEFSVSKHDWLDGGCSGLFLGWCLGGLLDGLLGLLRRGRVLGVGLCMGARSSF